MWHAKEVKGVLCVVALDKIGMRQVDRLHPPGSPGGIKNFT